MHFILTNDWTEGKTALTNRLVTELTADKKVLWLVSGGSNIPASIDIMKSIPSDLSHNLNIMLNDERYGPVGHPASNWNQLFEAGFDPKQAHMLPVLQPDAGFDESLSHYAAITEQALAENTIVISQIGMGADAHVAGILPGSPAAEEETALVSGYESHPFTRLTLTFPALRQIDVAYVFAYGDAKKPALEKLKTSDQPLSEVPALILKEIPEVYIYNDQIGD